MMGIAIRIGNSQPSLNLFFELLQAGSHLRKKMVRIVDFHTSGPMSKDFSNTDSSYECLVTAILKILANRY